MRKSKKISTSVVLFIASILYLLPTNLAFADNIQWVEKAPMPTARWALGAVNVNSEIYAMGGYASTGPSNSNESYNPTTNTWTIRPNLLTATSGPAVAAGNNGKIYVIGGSFNSYINTVQEYDPSTNSWGYKSPMPTAREAPGIKGSDGKIYVIGGAVGAINGGCCAITNAVEVYDPATDTWETKASMPTPRFAFAITATPNGKIYAIGGVPSNNTTALSTVEEYDITSNTWSARSSMPTPRNIVKAVLANNGKIYVIGGADNTNSCCHNLSTVEAYDPTSDVWEQSSNILYQLAGPAVELGSNGKIYTIGGVFSNGSPTNFTQEGTIVPSNQPPSVNSISISNNVISTGGYVTASANFTDANVLDTHTATWNWGDSSTTSGTITESSGTGSVSDTHVYSQAGVYEVSLTVNDNSNASASTTYQYLVVYDPAAGFVTGNGKYNNISPSGTVKFGFNVKYTNNNAIPSGDTKISFSAGNLALDATSYQWLVVSGAKAILKGNATVNGTSDYTFLISGMDGSQTNSQDLVRVQVKDNTNAVIYDTQPGDPDTANPTTIITSGTIKVH